MPPCSVALLVTLTLVLAACDEKKRCPGGAAGPALGGMAGATLGGSPRPVPPGGRVTATRNPDGTVTITARDGAGNTTSTTTVVPNTPGPGVRGEPAAGPAGSGLTYGDTEYRPDGGGSTEILDAQGRCVGYKTFAPDPLPGWEGVPPGGAQSWREDGTREILAADGEIVALLPPVAAGTKPDEDVRREWVPRGGGGGWWVYYDRNGRVVRVTWAAPGSADEGP